MEIKGPFKVEFKTCKLNVLFFNLLRTPSLLGKHLAVDVGLVCLAWARYHQDYKELHYWRFFL